MGYNTSINSTIMSRRSSSFRSKSKYDCGSCSDDDWCDGQCDKSSRSGWRKYVSNECYQPRVVIRETVYGCRCSLTFPSQKELIEHVCVKSVTVYTCKCGIEFHSKKELMEHDCKFTSRFSDDVRSCSQELVKTVYKCRCDEVFPSVKQLRKHDCRLVRKMYVCKCGVNILSEDELLLHECPLNFFRCQCGKILTTKEEAFNHIDCVKPEVIVFKCKCGVLFPSEQELDDHECSLPRVKGIVVDGCMLCNESAVIQGTCSHLQLCAYCTDLLGKDRVCSVCNK